MTVISERSLQRVRARNSAGGEKDYNAHERNHSQGYLFFIESEISDTYS